MRRSGTVIVVLMLRGGQVRSRHREEVGEGKELWHECIKGPLSPPGNCIFYSVDRNFLNADPR